MRQRSDLRQRIERKMAEQRGERHHKRWMLSLLSPPIKKNTIALPLPVSASSPRRPPRRPLPRRRPQTRKTAADAGGGGVHSQSAAGRTGRTAEERRRSSNNLPLFLLPRCVPTRRRRAAPRVRRSRDLPQRGRCSPRRAARACQGRRSGQRRP